MSRRCDIGVQGNCTREHVSRNKLSVSVTTIVTETPLAPAVNHVEDPEVARVNKLFLVQCFSASNPTIIAFFFSHYLRESEKDVE